MIRALESESAPIQFTSAEDATIPPYKQLSVELRTARVGLEDVAAPLLTCNDICLLEEKQ